MLAERVSNGLLKKDDKVMEQVGRLRERWQAASPLGGPSATFARCFEPPWAVTDSNSFRLPTERTPTEM
jgi:hypothetical protein